MSMNTTQKPLIILTRTQISVLHQYKLSGNSYAIPWKLCERSGVNPNPDQPIIGIWLSIIDIFR